ncbi:MAG TPA: hypothetical protein VGF08_01205 [Terriglobales bacterium]
MLPRTLLLLALSTLAVAQQPAQPPPVKVNVLNVCTPSAEEQKEISSALSRVPKQPMFTPDFEVARGRSSLSDKAQFMQAQPGGTLSSQPITAAWVRIRHEFSVQALFSNVQYSFSADSKSMIETLVLHVRDPKELVLLSIEDTASAVSSPAGMLAVSTPVDRVKLERFGKSSVVLARCTSSENGPPPDQSAYAPLFREASAIMGRYRELLGARRTVPEELAKVVAPAPAKARSAPQSVTKKPVPKN